MIETEWVCELCGQTVRPCLCAQAGMGAKLYEEKMRKQAAEVVVKDLPIHTQALKYVENYAEEPEVVSTASDLLSDLKAKLVESFNIRLKEELAKINPNGIFTKQNGDHNGHEVHDDS